ncbi:hypothetical protein F2Q70_00042244 [Brassica cretica]|uniref:Uncharacterized protein n=1 Tax=Brassica cretica TaxID=69181 RepID=A0A8S9KA94_BRACR|nr:hypothetical protein F2Q70_00042244 [Brassica cretica]
MSTWFSPTFSSETKKKITAHLPALEGFSPPFSLFSSLLFRWISPSPTRCAMSLKFVGQDLYQICLRRSCCRLKTAVYGAPASRVKKNLRMSRRLGFCFTDPLFHAEIEKEDSSPKSETGDITANYVYPVKPFTLKRRDEAKKEIVSGSESGLNCNAIDHVKD